MTHEFKHIINEAIQARKQGLKCVLASVVDLDGSSYRRPGVRMLIIENGNMIGAVSGGCVEKEIVLQAQSVFNSGQAKMMTYDGRYRLGCEGVLYILLELIELKPSFEKSFEDCIRDRVAFQITALYEKREGVFKGIGTRVKIGEESFRISKQKSLPERLAFHQDMLPSFRLVIIGAEHDAVQLSQYAKLTGWEVVIVAGISEMKTISAFPGADTLISTIPENLDVNQIDAQTAVVLMTHNFAYDLRYLVQLKNTKASYIGLLGPTKRREDLMVQLMEYCPDVSEDFLDVIHGPAGLDIGSETPQEIAISIVSEILSVTRNRNSVSLSQKSGSIHYR
ncbi:XdhC family protein [Seonamhaeicola sp. ML3]|uniref:XdhC family protein n=1 Tax=Seonamhaeicola sp. ML3 TaxID=2937786 RepID=UPI00201003B4|nr:XdhC/CoxI family protein [Seonamhaeicola sp. ML3]